jgi:hypothetical protein
MITNQFSALNHQSTQENMSFPMNLLKKEPLMRIFTNLNFNLKNFSSVNKSWYFLSIDGITHKNFINLKLLVDSVIDKEIPENNKDLNNLINETAEKINSIKIESLLDVEYFHFDKLEKMISTLKDDLEIIYIRPKNHTRLLSTQKMFNNIILMQSKILALKNEVNLAIINMNRISENDRNEYLLNLVLILDFHQEFEKGNIISNTIPSATIQEFYQSHFPQK